jgi:hypothetical protein
VTPSPSLPKRSQIVGATHQSHHAPRASRSVEGSLNMQNQHHGHDLNTTDCSLDIVDNREYQEKTTALTTPFPTAKNKRMFVSPSPVQKKIEMKSSTYKQIEKMGFDDLLSKFKTDVVESTDVRNRCDNQLVDLRVKLCVSENVSLRLHGCFDDILEDIEAAMDGQ